MKPNKADEMRRKKITIIPKPLQPMSTDPQRQPSSRKRQPNTQYDDYEDHTKGPVAKKAKSTSRKGKQDKTHKRSKRDTTIDNGTNELEDKSTEDIIDLDDDDNKEVDESVHSKNKLISEDEFST